MNMWQRIFGNNREYIEEIKRQNMELFEETTLKKSSELHVYLKGLTIPVLKKMTIQLNKDRNRKDGTLIEHVLNELESRIGQESLKVFCQKL